MSLLNLLLEKFSTDIIEKVYQEHKHWIDKDFVNDMENVINEFVLYDMSETNNEILSYRGSQYIRFYYKSGDENEMIQCRFANHAPDITKYKDKYKEEGRVPAHYYINSLMDWKNVYPLLIDFSHYVVIYLNAKYKMNNDKRDQMVEEEFDILKKVRNYEPLNKLFSYIPLDIVNTRATNLIINNENFKAPVPKVNWNDFENKLFDKLENYIAALT